MQHINVDRLHIKVDLQHLFERVLQIKESERPSTGDLQHLHLDLQHLRSFLQQKILDLQQISRRGVVREVDLQHALLRGRPENSTLRVAMQDEKLPPDREALIEAYLLGEISRETALRVLDAEQLEEIDYQDEVLRRDVEWGRKGTNT